ncbi:cysteine--tRNA ligase [Bradyrhizobium viridifuturi]|jgi:cysteinyl-tRNA synthetase|uniref:cysteine--tRNA ligase n=1 Tax=Bradyrhizobium TaxID=374 RepID=UPI0003977F71|nr:MULTISPECIES: cysteine--tRNA ligase [Bradyrhizobium]ERF79782.1 MAG: cysteinyl-tRNA synthetase [Bradyrhizobium sp. DFCI-1]OYU57905.1 MAG: cysteine--tRNA ligase [Bradyrhizobium sp. PARBB1]PSO24395.1 cysteine--tRNA ligase [Bradyrhizobium sp. MOS004]QRI72209.1 cysteine--tRNA ligase [Bradyrhizobium sp. PSBB068]MBR1021760.1 cysteine--tRNA ligase [Bradyrhizobium viridifuturi]
MDLRLYDTLTREKRPLVPLDANNVRMYACGPTVYDFAHIGNGRAAIVFDVLFRVLGHRYGADHVTYVRNITDVDDKINVRAARDYPGVPLNEAIRKVTELTYQQYQDDVTALGCLAPTVQPRATEHIPEMRAIIEKLVAGGFAYVAEDHVLFSPQAMNAANSVLPRYGSLSKRSLDEMIAGARVDVAPYKRDNTDFVLWKPSKPGEPSWPSPAGIAVEGRPGWHIECSAMAWKHLGEKFDIHGGGIDLVFPHHENELAQTCCAFHTDRMANVWMHNGFLQIESEKMSKSLGNFFTIRDLLADWPGEVLRLSMLKTHYRSPLDWTLKSAEESAKTLDDWYAVAADAEPGAPSQAMVEALYDDLNTAQAMAVLHGLRSASSSSEQSRREFAGSLRLLGFLSESAAAWEGRKRQASGVDAAAVEALIAERTAARARKDFKESDRIRDQLAAMGVAIKDGKDADGKPVTTWEVAR